MSGYLYRIISPTEHGNVPCCLSQRWILAYLFLLGFTFVYALRINLSMALVCMVRTENTTTELGTNVTDGDCVPNAQTLEKMNEHAEFDWDKTTVSSLTASFFYGYIITQIPGGWLADRYGGKRVFGYAMLISAISTLLMPVCTRASIVATYALRVILGLATAVSFPAMQSLWGRWAPKYERSRLISVSGLGTMFGFILTFSTSGVLCDYGFDNGWGSIFYIGGGCTLIWVAIWFIVVSDTPDESKWISEVERNYINSNIEYNTAIRTSRVPWKSIASSPAVWACLTAHICNNWTNYTLLTSLPMFMKEALKFDVKSVWNGFLSAVPYVASLISAFISGQTADIIRSKRLLNTTNTRKVYQIIAFLGAGALLIATGFMTCAYRNLAVAFLSLAVMFTGLCRAGYTVNHVDFAPKYAGVMYGITNTFATIPGMVAPLVAGALTPNKTQEEWRSVFYVCAAFDLFGAIVFGVFASGELQPWAEDKIELVVIPNEHTEKAVQGNSSTDKPGKDAAYEGTANGDLVAKTEDINMEVIDNEERGGKREINDDANTNATVVNNEYSKNSTENEKRLGADSEIYPLF
ncbi:hypothetical protein FSP39_013216 [Pinctada imbricata]|uniref:Major facilitator superfamily (MFS) profile domain-containing protein n=1 Tax=Pinctada imbricata TaxID=66713 RepID=A0AA89C964_PINIB|nr:hypothetical protein FSP39_013216 [Pinctada imbricata]